MFVKATPEAASALVDTNPWAPTAMTTLLPSAAATLTSPVPGADHIFRQLPPVLRGLALPQILVAADVDNPGVARIGGDRKDAAGLVAYRPRRG